MNQEQLARVLTLPQLVLLGSARSSVRASTSRLCLGIAANLLLITQFAAKVYLVGGFVLAAGLLLFLGLRLRRSRKAPGKSRST